METKAELRLKKSGHGSYFKMNIHQRINERSQRNGLNINYLFSTVIGQCVYRFAANKSACCLLGAVRCLVLKRRSVN
jgi:hypothetical protein